MAHATLRLWDVASATDTTCLEGHTEEVNGMAFSPDGATLASASNDGSQTNLIVFAGVGGLRLMARCDTVVLMDVDRDYGPAGDLLTASTRRRIEAGGEAGADPAARARGCGAAPTWCSTAWRNAPASPQHLPPRWWQ